MTVEVTDNGSDRVTEGDTLMEGEEHGKDGGGWKGGSVLHISIQACAEGLSNYVNSEKRRSDVGLWPSLTKEQTTTTVSSGYVRVANEYSRGYTMTVMM